MKKEPKFKYGEMVKYNGKVYKITGVGSSWYDAKEVTESNEYCDIRITIDAEHEDEMEPYEMPEPNDFEYAMLRYLQDAANEMDDEGILYQTMRHGKFLRNVARHYCWNGESKFRSLVKDAMNSDGMDDDYVDEWAYKLFNAAIDIFCDEDA